MKNILKTGLVLFILISLTSILSAQEGGHEPEMPKDEAARMHAEGMMMGEKVMLLDLYSDDVQIFIFPSTPLANGKEEAEKYWTEKFKKKTEKSIEVLDFYEVGNKLIVRTREFNAETMVPEIKAMIFEFEKSKIIGLYFIEA